MPPQRRPGAVTRPRPAPATASATKAAPSNATVAVVTPKPPAFTIGSPRSLSERYLNAFIFGPPGHGKTTLCCSAVFVPQMQDVLLISAEAGDMSVSGSKWAKLDIININRYTQVARIYEFLRLHVRARDAGDDAKLLELQQRYMGDSINEPNRLRRYRTVIIDSLSEVQKYLMYQLLNIDLGAAPLDIEPDIADRREWQNSAEMIRLLIRSFRDLPMHCLIVSAEEEVTNDAGKILKVQPRLPGKLAGEPQGFVDIVGYQERRKSEEGFSYRLYLGAGHARFNAKHRFENLPDLDYVEDPTMQKLFDLDKEDARLATTATATATATERRSSTSSQATTPARTGAGDRGRGRGAGAVRGSERRDRR